MSRRRHVAVISEIKIASWVTNVQNRAHYALTYYSSIYLHVRLSVCNQSEYFTGQAHALKSSMGFPLPTLTSLGCIFVVLPPVLSRTSTGFLTCKTQGRKIGTFYSIAYVMGIYILALSCVWSAGRDLSVEKRLSPNLHRAPAACESAARCSSVSPAKKSAFS